MIRRTSECLHRGGRSRGFLHKDPALTSSTNMGGARTLNRIGVTARTGHGFSQTGFFGQAQYDHAFPLLSHDDLGHSDQSNDTHHVLLSSYMPKRNKGTAPWFRGADTYSVKYSEQGRYEYQRYLMIQRFPSEYRRDFLKFLRFIKAAGTKNVAVIPQEAVHWVQRMIVDNYNPQHAHYIAAMTTLAKCNEPDMARDVWQIMERQQTWPCDTTIATYLGVCAQARERTWALECWNRYCSEKRFLSAGEADPKPVTRKPFSLNRDELLYLPKWKKFFDHDPNLDVIDLNRFNTTRNIYHQMAQVMLASGDLKSFWSFYEPLEKALLTTPTPVPEPPNALLIRPPRWAPHESISYIQPEAWRQQNSVQTQALGPPTTAIKQLAPRFFSNKQFILHVAAEACTALARGLHADVSPAQAVDFSKKLYERVRSSLGVHYAGLNAESLICALLHVRRVHERKGGAALLADVKQLLADQAAAAPDTVPAAITSAMWLQVLEGFAAESAHRGGGGASAFNPKAIIQQLGGALRAMADDPHVEWAADMHLAIVKTMVHCGTMAANDYFVKNVLRKFPWTSDFLEALYVEYRRAADVDTWSELTKRALVWTARYDVEVSESLKRLIEDDYGTIQVQVRTFRELAIFQFRDVEEKRHARDAVNALPNPWMDFVSHALPFPDRDTGYPNEYGEIGQWRAPVGAIKGPGFYAPRMYGEHLKGYTSEWRDPTNPGSPPSNNTPHEARLQTYSRGQHPSYDMTYAGATPEIFPTRKVFRPKTRWDQFDIQKQSKTRIQGPY